MSTVLQLPVSRHVPRAQSVERWDAHAYLREYYSRLEPTELHTLRFLADALRREPPLERVLDFGAGPTLHHALALAARARELHIADLRPENLRAIRRWLNDAPRAHDWSAFTREVLRLEGLDGSDERVAERDARLRACTKRVLLGDARRAQPLAAGGGGYDCVTSFFCADSATRDLCEWRCCVRNIAALLRPGGLLIMGALRCCSAWRLGNGWLPSACIDECHVRYVLDCAGFDQRERVIEIAEVPEQRPNGFESILLVSARARRVSA